MSLNFFPGTPAHAVGPWASKSLRAQIASSVPGGRAPYGCSEHDIGLVMKSTGLGTDTGAGSDAHQLCDLGNFLYLSEPASSSI